MITSGGEMMWAEGESLLFSIYASLLFESLSNIHYICGGRKAGRKEGREGVREGGRGREGKHHCEVPKSMVHF